MHKIKDTSTTPLQLDAFMTDYTCLDTCVNSNVASDTLKKSNSLCSGLLWVQLSNIQNVASAVQCSLSQGFTQWSSFWTQQCYIATCSICSVALGVASALGSVEVLQVWDKSIKVCVAVYKWQSDGAKMFFELVYLLRVVLEWH